MLLAIETSCDETAAAVFDISKVWEGEASFPLLSEVISSQIKLHQPYGGVVPELAAREHIKNLPLVVNQALRQAGIAPDALSAVAVTRGPGLKGCLLTGLSFAKAVSYSLGVPLLPVNHLEGHLLAGELISETKYPMMALLVSGGHTQLIFAPKFRSYTVLASTRDDAAGEAFDKIGSLLGLPYPGGPALSKAAVGGNKKAYDLPLALSEDPRSFSFSGLKTAALRLVQELGEKIKNEDVIADFCASVEHAIVETLVKKTVIHLKQTPPQTFLLTGGVAANRSLRDRLSETLSLHNVEFRVLPPQWCTDNAAMIGAVAARILCEKHKIYSQWNQESEGNLGPQVSFALDARARWPLSELDS